MQRTPNYRGIQTTHSSALKYETKLTLYSQEIQRIHSIDMKYKDHTGFFFLKKKKQTQNLHPVVIKTADCAKIFKTHPVVIKTKCIRY